MLSFALRSVIAIVALTVIVQALTYHLISYPLATGLLVAVFILWIGVFRFIRMMITFVAIVLVLG